MGVQDDRDDKDGVRWAKPEITRGLRSSSTGWEDGEVGGTSVLRKSSDTKGSGAPTCRENPWKGHVDTGTDGEYCGISVTGKSRGFFDLTRVKTRRRTS